MKFIESTRGAMLAIKYDATPIEDAIPIDFEVLPVIVPINNEIKPNVMRINPSWIHSIAKFMNDIFKPNIKVAKT